MTASKRTVARSDRRAGGRSLSLARLGGCAAVHANRVEAGEGEGRGRGRGWDVLGAGVRAASDASD